MHPGFYQFHLATTRIIYEYIKYDGELNTKEEHYWKLRGSLVFEFLGKDLKTVGNLIPYGIS
jgi:hypothetical protein